MSFLTSSVPVQSKGDEMGLVHVHQNRTFLQVPNMFLFFSWVPPKVTLMPKSYERFIKDLLLKVLICWYVKKGTVDPQTYKRVFAAFVELFSGLVISASRNARAARGKWISLAAPWIHTERYSPDCTITRVRGALRTTHVTSSGRVVKFCSQVVHSFRGNAGYK